MPTRSAGIVLYATFGQKLKVLLVHPGGPYFASRDEGSWGIPKGMVNPEEDEQVAALRELQEETGITLKPEVPLMPLSDIRLKSGKRVMAWAAPYDGPEVIDVVSNTYEIRWPPKTGKLYAFPEVDRAEFFTLPEAKVKMMEAQTPFLERLLVVLKK